jgi:flagellar biosynthesis/type III secretory pathway protein FliH
MLKKKLIAATSAKIHAAPLSPELAISSFREIVSGARHELAKERVRSRNKALRHAKLVRSRSFKAGYSTGIATAQTEISALLSALRNCYDDVVDKAQNDTYALALEIARQIIDTTLIKEPTALISWVHQGLKILKSSQNVELSLHPRYNGIVQAIKGALPSGINTAIDPSVGERDFVLKDLSSLRGVEFSWQEVLTN